MDLSPASRDAMRLPAPFRLLGSEAHGFFPGAVPPPL